MWHQRWLERERVIITKAQRKERESQPLAKKRERETLCDTEQRPLSHTAEQLSAGEKVCCIALWPLLTTWEQMRMRGERPKSLVAKRGDDDEFLASQQQRQPQRRREERRRHRKVKVNHCSSSTLEH